MACVERVVGLPVAGEDGVIYARVLGVFPAFEGATVTVGTECEFSVAWTADSEAVGIGERIGG